MQEAIVLKEGVSKNLIIAENFSYNYCCLPELISQLSKKIINKKEISRITFSELTSVETAQYKQYLLNQQTHGDMYRQLDLGGRIYDGDLSLQSCPTLCDLIDGSPPGSPIHGIFQARVLEWGAIAFSSTYVMGT